MSRSRKQILSRGRRPPRLRWCRGAFAVFVAMLTASGAGFAADGGVLDCIILPDKVSERWW